MSRSGPTTCVCNIPQTRYGHVYTCTRGGQSKIPLAYADDRPPPVGLGRFGVARCGGVGVQIAFGRDACFARIPRRVRCFLKFIFFFSGLPPHPHTCARVLFLPPHSLTLLPSFGLPKDALCARTTRRRGSHARAFRAAAGFRARTQLFN